jgi:hypothetical protein
MKSATGKAFTAAMIQWIRFKHKIENPLLRSQHELTVKEVATRFGISTHMVYYYISTHILPARKTKKGILITISPTDEAAFRYTLLNAPKAAPRKAIPKEMAEHNSAG